MARLPFDPERVKVPDTGGPALREQARYGQFDTARPLTVTQVCELIKRVLADRTPTPMRIVGEVSNFSDRNHWFFSLKDESSVIACVMWSSASRKCGFVPDRGQQVVATGRLDYYGPQGKLQLYVDQLEPVGQGVLELRYRQLCDELRKLGYFDDARKRPMPAFPTHIAVVTSATGAAVQDVIRTARQRWPGIRISVVDVRVQGAAAAPEVAAAIDGLGHQHEQLGLDAIILTRGGGSLEDLWAFNERVVADAVQRCAVPIVAAIGHETDTTVAELVADLRCSTPTQAAARLVPDARAERHRLDQLASRLSASLRRSAQHARAQLDAVANHPIFRRPAHMLVAPRTDLDHARQRLQGAIANRISRWREQISGYRHALSQIEPHGNLRLGRHRLADKTERLEAAMQRRVTQRRQHVDELARVLRAIGPENVLKRGYSYTTDDQGRLVKSVEAAGVGQIVTTHLVDGQFRSQVIGDGAAEHQPAVKKTPQSKPKSGRGRRKSSPPQDGGLFGEI